MSNANLPLAEAILVDQDWSRAISLHPACAFQHLGNQQEVCPRWAQTESRTAWSGNWGSKMSQKLSSSSFGKDFPNRSSWYSYSILDFILYWISGSTVACRRFSRRETRHVRSLCQSFVADINTCSHVLKWSWLLLLSAKPSCNNACPTVDLQCSKEQFPQYGWQGIMGWYLNDPSSQSGVYNVTPRIFLGVPWCSSIWVPKKQ